MSKSELAERYGVHKTTLRRWIVGNNQLMEKLREIGFKKHRNLLTAKELSLIMEYLG
jgi:transposase-like protein